MLYSRGLDESKARWFFQQLILGMDYCHKMNISNRDIKLENTLLHSQGADRRPMVKLCDFGQSLHSFFPFDCLNEDPEIKTAKKALFTQGIPSMRITASRRQQSGLRGIQVRNWRPNQGEVCRNAATSRETGSDSVSMIMQLLRCWQTGSDMMQSRPTCGAPESCCMQW